MDKKELCKKVAKEILPKLDEIIDILEKNDIERISWMNLAYGGYVDFSIAGNDFARADRESDFTVTYKEKV